MSTNGAQRLVLRRDGVGPWILDADTPPEAGLDACDWPSSTLASPIRDVWDLELLKVQRALGLDARSRVRAFCKEARCAPHVAHSLHVEDDVQLWAQVVCAEMEGGGDRVVWDGRDGTVSRWLRVVAAVFAGIGGLALTALRMVGEASDALPNASALAAVHGEESNRTRHVLSALGAAAPETPVLVLGRPHGRLNRFRDMAARFGLPNAPITRPFRPRDLLGTVGAAASIIRDGYRATTLAPSLPTIAELAGIVYRVLLGRASAAWWHREGPMVDKIVYGHTGLADTSALETAQQTTGARTLHWLHGVTAGSTWVGVSDYALFACESDAAWHRRLDGYSVCLALPDAPPPLLRGGHGVALLTNLIHPMNKAYRRDGPAETLALFRWVRAALEAAGLGEMPVEWKPHPTYAQQPDAVRAEVDAERVRNGFHVWPEQASLDHIRTVGLVLTTPSTVALDVLRQGMLPIVLAARPIEPGSAIATLPLVATDLASLRHALAEVQTPARLAELYARAWADVGPGRAVDWHDVVGAMTTGATPPHAAAYAS